VTELRIIISPPGKAQPYWSPHPDVKDWETFVEWLRDGPTDGGKYARPYSPITLSSRRRRNAKLELRYALTLDADSAGPDYLDRLAETVPWRRLSHTTASHTPEEPRWRTLVPISRPVAPAEGKTLAVHLVGLVGAERFDVQASTSPVAVAYAPAWDGVEYDEHDGPVLDVDEVLVEAEPVEWSAADPVGRLTVDEFRDEHEQQSPSCTYGRHALDGEIARLETTVEGDGVHWAIYHAAARAVELVSAGCWSIDDVEKLAEVSAGLRTVERPEEFDEALANALRRTEAETACGLHGDFEPEPRAEPLFARLNLVVLLDPARPPRRWLWGGLVPEGDQASIVAPGGTGKSLLVLSLSLAAVAGEAEFIGRALVFSGQVLYIDMENSEDDWAERLRDLGWDSESIASVADRFVPLSLPALRGLDTREGAEQLRQAIADYGIGRGDLLVLDSTQRVTEGPENDNDTLRALYSNTAVWLKARGITVLRTDNTGWDTGRERGASAKRDDVGYSLLLEPIGGERFRLRNTKHRSRGSGGDLAFLRTTDEAGRLVFEPIAVDDGRTVSKMEREIVAFVRRRMAEVHGSTDDDGNVMDGRPNITQIRREVTGRSDRIKQCVDELVALGVLVEEHLQQGKTTRDVYNLGPLAGPETSSD
jgi:hypothetical protein